MFKKQYVLAICLLVLLIPISVISQSMEGQEYDFYVTKPVLSKTDITTGTCCDQTISAKINVFVRGEGEDPVSGLMRIYMYDNTLRNGEPVLEKRRWLRFYPGSERTIHISFDPSELEEGTYYVFVKGDFKDLSSGEEESVWTDYSVLEVNSVCESCECPECPVCEECPECPVTKEPSECEVWTWFYCVLLGVLVALILILLMAIIIRNRRRNREETLE